MACWCERTTHGWSCRRPYCRTSRVHEIRHHFMYVVMCGMIINLNRRQNVDPVVMMISMVGVMACFAHVPTAELDFVWGQQHHLRQGPLLGCIWLTEDHCTSPPTGRPSQAYLSTRGAAWHVSHDPSILADAHHHGNGILRCFMCQCTLNFGRRVWGSLGAVVAFWVYMRPWLGTCPMSHATVQ